MEIRRPFTHMVLNKDLVGGAEWSWMSKCRNTMHIHLLYKLFIVSLLNDFCWEQGIGHTFTAFWAESLDASLHPDFDLMVA